MLADGFLDEVRSLMMRPDYDPDSPAMRAVGYRQAIDFNRGAHRYGGLSSGRRCSHPTVGQETNDLDEKYAKCDFCGPYYFGIDYGKGDVYKMKEKTIDALT